MFSVSPPRRPGNPAAVLSVLPPCSFKPTAPRSGSGMFARSPEERSHGDNDRSRPRTGRVARSGCPQAGVVGAPKVFRTAVVLGHVRAGCHVRRTRIIPGARGETMAGSCRETDALRSTISLRTPLKAWDRVTVQPYSAALQTPSRTSAPSRCSTLRSGTRSPWTVSGQPDGLLPLRGARRALHLRAVFRGHTMIHQPPVGGTRRPSRGLASRPRAWDDPARS